MIGVWLRSWLARPLLAAQYALTIAVGMGTLTAVVSLMLALGYQPLPFRDPGQLVEVWERVQSGAETAYVSGPDLADLAGATPDIFTELGAFTTAAYWVLDDQRGAERVRACYIEEAPFSALDIHPVLGRGVRADDLPAGSAAMPPAWISYRLWRGRYGRRPSVIGETIRLAQDATGQYEARYEIAGVLPPGANVPYPNMTMADATDVWFIMRSDLKVQRPRQAELFLGLGRLRPGVDIAQAQTALTAVAARLRQGDGVSSRKTPLVERLEAMAQGPARRTMGLLTLGVGMVFLLGFANLAIMMVSEGGRRRREIAIRAALGAGRRRLWAEVAAEQGLLTLLSLGLGVALTATFLRLLARLVPAAGLGPPLADPPALNVAVLVGFTLVALAAALAWSWMLVAAAEGRGSTRALAAGSWLGDAGLRTTDRGAGRWRLMLLAAQSGIGICLMAAAVLATRAYATRTAVDLGPAPRNTFLLSVRPSTAVAGMTDAQATSFNDDVLSRLERLPGTQAIALAYPFPNVGSAVSFRKQGDADSVARAATAPSVVSNGFFRTLGIPLLFGRGFDDTDRIDGEPVAVINLEMAAKNWAAPEEAVGAEITFGSSFQRHYRIIGVVGNFAGFWAQAPVPTLYRPETQAPSAGGDVILRTTDPTGAVAELARHALAGMTMPAMISGVSTMQARWQATVTRPMARMAGMLLLALLGLALAVQGVYAVAAATVAARGHELAVRAALGAPGGRLAWTVTRELMLAAAAGATGGAAGALGLQRLLAEWLESSATTPVEPIAGAMLLLVLAAAVGCYVPARAAARANPVDVLRQG